MNWKNQSGMTAFMWASGRGHIEVMKLLLESGAHLDLQDSNLRNRWTALMKACYHGKIDCVRLLLESGADLSKKDGDGKTAKDCAKMKQEHVDIIQLLDEVCMVEAQNTIILIPT